MINIILVIYTARTFLDINEAIEKYGSIGISCGSLFVYKGSRKAVLINYPSKEDKLKLILKDKIFLDLKS